MSKHILTVPNPVLRTESVDVDPGEQSVAQFIHELEDTLQKKASPRGVGLSAPQIGKNWNMFSTFLSDDNDDDSTAPPNIRTFINPIIVKMSSETTFGPDPENPYLEGCLSIPKIYGPVPRPTWIKMKYVTPNGKNAEGMFDGFLGRVIQHEFDHLRGVLFTDYTLQLNLPLYRMEKRKLVEIDNSIAQVFG